VQSVEGYGNMEPWLVRGVVCQNDHRAE